MKRIIVFSLCALPMWGSVLMQYENLRNTPSGFYHFSVDGTELNLLCDDVGHDLGQVPYQANVLSLTDDLSGTVLGRQHDRDTLAKYTMIAILDSQAYSHPDEATGILFAIRHIVNPLYTPMPEDFAYILDWAQAQNPADYNLTWFHIYANATVQEQTGGVGPDVPPIIPPHTRPPDTTPTPEPSTFLLAAGSFAAFFAVARWINSTHTS